MTAESRPLAARILVPGRIHYGWAMAAVTLVVLVMSAGFRSTAGVLIVPLEHEFGWSPATVSSAVSINLIMFGLGAPFAAALHDRFGVRRVTVTALLVVAAASAATTLISAPWQLRVLWGLVIGSATGAISIPLAAIVGNRWFVRRRGLVTGVMTAANATGQLIFLPLLAAIVTAAGWRWASATVAVVALTLVVPLAALVMRDRPADLGLAPYGAEALESAPERASGPVRTALAGLAEGARSGTFWLLAGSFFVCGASTNGLIGTHLIPAAADHGVSEVTAASYLAAIGVFDIIGTTFSGWLTDRYDPRALLFSYYGLRGLSLLGLHSVLGSPSLGLLAFIVFYGLDWVATVPPTVALTADAFGRERVGVLFGWIFAAHQFGAAFAAYGAGAIRTDAGSYHWAFLISGAMCMGASFAVTRIRTRRAQPATAPV
ncbi:MAG TPA: MFS transporter [Gaiellales bacterium]|nr:MFS transporter [Gaiellales bacterium]